jgi:molecular chaperone GrpE
MADNNPSADAAAGSETRDNAAAAPEARAPGEPSAVGETIDPNDHARVAAEYKDKLLRVLAEMENLRRRTAREIADTRAYGISAFARDILAVARMPLP